MTSPGAAKTRATAGVGALAQLLHLPSPMPHSLTGGVVGAPLAAPGGAADRGPLACAAGAGRPPEAEAELDWLIGLVTGLRAARSELGVPAAARLSLQVRDAGARHARPSGAPRRGDPTPGPLADIEIATGAAPAAPARWWSTRRPMRCRWPGCRIWSRSAAARWELAERRRAPALVEAGQSAVPRPRARKWSRSSAPGGPGRVDQQSSRRRRRASRTVQNLFSRYTC